MTEKRSQTKQTRKNFSLLKQMHGAGGFSGCPPAPLTCRRQEHTGIGAAVDDRYGRVHGGCQDGTDLENKQGIRIMLRIDQQRTGQLGTGGKPVSAGQQCHAPKSWPVKSFRNKP
jgi:hypothetical protein